MIPIHQGLAAVAERYDGYILDLWGVLHDGLRAFPAAVDCLARLRARGARIVVLSNAPRRAEVIAARNAEIGLPRELCDGLVSSGELAWHHLSKRPDAWYQGLGRSCYHLGPERDLNMREGLAYRFVADVGAADFILNTGALAAEDTVGDYDPLLRRALERRLRMICANPDLEVMRGAAREICAGAIAASYEAMGGEVRYHGKPHAEAYEACFPFFDGAPRRRIVAIGDAMRTDIAGAAGAGIDAIYITNGIDAPNLGVDARGNPDPARLAEACARAGLQPVAAMPALRW